MGNLLNDFSKTYSFKIVPYKGSFALKENNKLYRSIDNTVKKFDSVQEAETFKEMRKNILFIYFKDGY